MSGLTVASYVMAAGYILATVAAIPAKRWAVTVEWVAIGLAAATSVLDFVRGQWIAGLVWVAIVGVSVWTLRKKLATLRLRAQNRRWFDN